MELRCAVIELALIDAGVIVPPTQASRVTAGQGLRGRETLLTRDMNDFLEFG